MTARDNHIGLAIYRLKQGKRVRRRKWPPNYYLEMASASYGSNIGDFIAVSDGTARQVWFPGHHELFADDWEAMP